MELSVLCFISGYLVNLLANIYLITAIMKDKHIEGLSFQTQIIYATAMIAKCTYFTMSILAEFWIGWLEMFLSIVASVYLNYLFFKYRKRSFAYEKDFTITLVVIPLCFFFSIFMHPGFIEEGFDFSSMMIAFGVRPFMFLTFQELLRGSSFHPPASDHQKGKAYQEVDGYLHHPDGSLEAFQGALLDTVIL